MLNITLHTTKLIYFNNSGITCPIVNENLTIFSHFFFFFSLFVCLTIFFLLVLNQKNGVSSFSWISHPEFWKPTTTQNWSYNTLKARTPRERLIHLNNNDIIILWTPQHCVESLLSFKLLHVFRLCLLAYPWGNFCILTDWRWLCYYILLKAPAQTPVHVLAIMT